MVLTDEMKMIITAEVEKAISDMEAWDDQIDESGDHIEKMAKDADAHFQTMQKSLDKAANKMLIWTGVVAGAGGVGLKFAGDMESQMRTFENMTGSVETATELFKELQETSIKTPLEPEEVNKAAEALLTYQFAAEDVNETFLRLGDVAKGEANTLDTVTRAYGRIHLKGKASMEELNMLTEAGIPILAELSKQYDVTTEELFKMVSGGKVGFSEVENAFITMTSEGGQFFKMMETQSTTLEGKWSTTMGALKMSSAEAMDSLLPLAKDVLDQITELANKFIDLDDSSQQAIVSLLGISAGVGPVMKVISQVMSLQTSLTLAGSAVSALQLGLIGLGAAGVIAGIVLIISKFKQAREEAQGLADDLYSIGTGKEVQNIQADILNSFAELEQARIDSMMYGIEYVGPDEIDKIKQIAREFHVASADVARLAVELGKGTDEIDKYIAKAEEEEKIRDAMLQMAESRIMVQDELNRQAEEAAAAAEREKELQEEILKLIEEQEKVRVRSVIDRRDEAEEEYRKAVEDAFVYMQAGWIDNEEAIQRNQSALEDYIKVLVEDLDYDLGLTDNAGFQVFDANNIDINGLNELEGKIKGIDQLEIGEQRLLSAIALWKELGQQIEGVVKKEKTLLDSLYADQLQNIAEQKEAEAALSEARELYLTALHYGETEQADLYANIIEKLEQMLGLEEQITEEKAGQAELVSENFSILDEYKDKLNEILSLDSAAEGLYSTFDAIGEALSKGENAADAAGDAFKDFVADISSDISKMAIAAGLRLIAEGGTAMLPVGIALLAIGGVSSIATGFFSGGSNYTSPYLDMDPWSDYQDTYNSPGTGNSDFDPNDYPEVISMIFGEVIDAEEQLALIRMESLDDLVAYAREKRDEEIKDLDRQYSEEFTVLRDQWERNLISTEEFKQQLNTLNTNYDAGIDAVNTDFEEEEENIETQKELDAKAIEEARAIKLSKLLAQLKDLQEQYDYYSNHPLRFLTKKDEDLLEGIHEMEARIQAAESATTISEINAARKGADFITTGPQLLLVGDNPGGKEKVQVTPMSSPNYNGPQSGGRDTYIIQGDVYGIEDLYSKLKAVGAKVEFMGK